jgi:signal transduction histidine kinase/CheY-like chemotaxis protein
MRATQHIFRVRRQYNQWVANQTLEDYALRFTAKTARRWSAKQVALTALGATAFMALEAIGGAITLHYGFFNAFVAMLTVGAVIFIIGFPISYHAAKYGVDIDLLTRGAGFGYLGSTITSLIYASFTFIFFAIEAAIMAMALKALLGIPMTIGYVICSLAVIPIVTHGITFISKFQMGTQPVWLALQCLGLFAVVYFEVNNISQWTYYQGIEQPSTVPSGGFNLILFGAAASVLFALVAQVGEQVDYLRFLPPKESTPALHWWSALIMAGPGWIFVGIIKMLAGSFLAYLAFTGGTSLELATDPTHMYQVAFNYVTNSPNAALIMSAIMVIISQMKINVTNAYAGSIAWSNFFSRLTHSHPGRVVWLVFNVAIALLLMELGIYTALESILGMFAIIAVSWLGTLSADLLINKSLKLSPPFVEFKRAHLYDINPVGVGSMIAAALVGMCCYLGVFGYEAKALAHFFTLGATFLITPLIAYITQGKYYIARPTSDLITGATEHECCICENSFESEDMSHCPAYQGPICSLCCSLDARCLDSCKPEARFSSQVIAILSKIFSGRAASLIKTQFGHFLVILIPISLITAGSLWLIYYHMAPQDPALGMLLVDMLITLFFILLIIFGVLSWLFLLAHESRVVAQEESNNQTHRLIAEIDAHKETDLALQDAKELAETANQAKSRYLSGISHELRTPLQSILGYAQLLSRDPTIPPELKESIAIMHRSGEYLTDLIEGLLDISKIEASKLDIHSEQVDLQQLLEQIVHIFGQQAEAKSIVFNYTASGNLPQYVRTDEKRLRQILINVISNAVKFTEQGSVCFEVQYRNQVAEFTITDTGVGIENKDMERIFNPFERIRKTGVPNVPGTGLGLTIVKLLCDIMGGDIKVTSTPNQGTCLKIMMMLSSVDAPTLPEPKAKLTIGYHGIQKKILIVDDETNHRGFIRDFLTPLGFDVLEAQDAEACLNVLDQCQPDVFLIDVSMPGMNGLELADYLRKTGYKTPIIMISGDAQERHIQPDAHFSHNAYMVKPIKLQSLQDHLHNLVGIDWIYEKTDNPPTPSSLTDNNYGAIPNHPLFDQLIAYAEIGYTKGVREIIQKLRAEDSIDASLVAHLEQLSKQQLHNKIVAILQVKTL